MSAQMARKLPVLDDPVRRLVSDTLHQQRVSWNEASRNIGMNPTYLWHFLVRGSPQILPDEVRGKLARLLDLDEARLVSPPTESKPPSAAGKTVGALYKDHATGAQWPLDPVAVDLPVYRVQSYRGLPLPASSVQQHVARPAMLAGIDGAFAVRVPDDALVPRYSPGDILYFSPVEPPEVGDGVCVEVDDGNRLVAVLDEIGPGGIIVIYYRPEERRESLPLERVKAIVREVGVKRRG